MLDVLIRVEDAAGQVIRGPARHDDDHLTFRAKVVDKVSL